jgi:effector-binding domain-containing protein
VKSLGELLVASIRFVGQYADIPAHFARLHAKVGPYVAGDPICLYDRTADENPQEAHTIEVCYPVSRPVSAGDIQSWLLPGCQVASATHVGPAGVPWGPAEWWRSLGAYINDHHLTIDEDPLREIRRPAGNGLEVSELQAVLQFPRWLKNLAAGLDRLAGEGVRRSVMAGSADLRVDAPVHERLAWIQEAMERLDAAVSDPATRGCILNGCAHRFPSVRIARMREAYGRLGDVAALLDLMRADRSVGGSSWYGSPVREGAVIYETKDPASPEQYREAGSEVERRAAACFCPVVRAAILAGETISSTYCHCGAGWYVQLWEGILQQPVRVEVLETVLEGGERCRFAIHLPPEVLG